MNWDAIGAIGEATSALALIFVIQQVRLTRAESRRAFSQARAEAIREINSQWLDERIATIWTKANIALDVPVPPTIAALMERAKLTREEALVAVTALRTVWAHLCQIIPKVDDLSSIERSELEYTVRMHFGPNGGPGRIFYETYSKTAAHPDAVRFVENLLAQSPDRFGSS